MQINISLIIMQISICLIIVQTTICLIILQILYSCHSYLQCMIQLFKCISIHTKLIFLFVILNILNIKRNFHVKCISHCICYSIVKILYIGKGKRGIKKRTKEVDAQHYAPCTLNYMCVCILLLVIMNC